MHLIVIHFIQGYQMLINAKIRVYTVKKCYASLFRLIKGTCIKKIITHETNKTFFL